MSEELFGLLLVVLLPLLSASSLGLLVVILKSLPRIMKIVFQWAWNSKYGNADPAEDRWPKQIQDLDKHLRKAGRDSIYGACFSVFAVPRLLELLGGEFLAVGLFIYSLLIVLLLLEGVFVLLCRRPIALLAEMVIMLSLGTWNIYAGIASEGLPFYTVFLCLLGGVQIILSIKTGWHYWKSREDWRRYAIDVLKLDEKEANDFRNIRIAFTITLKVAVQPIWRFCTPRVNLVLLATTGLLFLVSAPFASGVAGRPSMRMMHISVLLAVVFGILLWIQRLNRSREQSKRAIGAFSEDEHRVIEMAQRALGPLVRTVDSCLPPIVLRMLFLYAIVLYALILVSCLIAVGAAILTSHEFNTSAVIAMIVASAFAIRVIWSAQKWNNTRKKAPVTCVSAWEQEPSEDKRGYTLPAKEVATSRPSHETARHSRSMHDQPTVEMNSRGTCPECGKTLSRLDKFAVRLGNASLVQGFWGLFDSVLVTAISQPTCRKCRGMRFKIIFGKGDLEQEGPKGNESPEQESAGGIRESADTTPNRENRQV